MKNLDDNTPIQQAPLSSLQLELLKLYSTELSAEELNEIKAQLGQYFAKKAIGAANQIWQEGKLSNEQMEKWLNDPHT